MDHLKEGINLRAYAQKDPLTEYKRESFSLFENVRDAVKKSVIENVYTIQLYTKEEIEILQKKHQEELEAQLEASKNAFKMSEQGNDQSATIRRQGNKVGRNDPCPCGSEKKFKHCHGA